MSLSVYQRELAAMVASPARRRAIASDVRALAGLRLTRRERARLVAFSRDPGMEVNTILYRANRLSPIYNVLPSTCDALGDELPALVHAYWSSRAIEDLQWVSEAARFAAFLRAQAAHVLAATPGLRGLLGYELARYELAMLPRREIRARVRPPLARGVLHPLVRVVPFEVDAQAVLDALARGEVALRGLVAAPCAVLIDRRVEPGVEGVIAAAVGDHLTWCSRPVRPGARGWATCSALGLLVDA